MKKIIEKSQLLQDISDYMMVRGCSKRTITSYIYWIKYFILYCDKQHPEALNSEHIEKFLTFLSVTRNASPLTHFKKALTQTKLLVVLT
ncbi:phage integrase N-terminal SAM-like domain-containing protein [Alteromonas sp. 5E99-2]|nr:phage integrase N-terminal SAM-like domain-containing protein [Alteromonas sp. 5E99-2]